jgi:predicted RND superfamily exporter protein
MAADPWFEHQRVLDVVNHWITERPGAIIVVFVLLTGLFALGLPYITLDPGEGGFTEDLPEMDAQEQVNEEFQDPFEADEQSTQLIQRGENVVSKQGILRMLRLQHRIEQTPELRVADTSSPAEAFAMVLNPDAETREAQIHAVEEASETEVREAVRYIDENNPSVVSSLSDDFNADEPYASAQIGIVDHEIPEGDDAAFERVQFRTADVADSVGGDVIVFGSAIFDDEMNRALVDSMSLMIPVVMLLILIFLLFAYRDPFDLVLGLVALTMAVIWTFGLLGHARIPFNQVMIAIPPLLLALGIDFGIHSVNRYREERVEGRGIRDGMIVANNQLFIAFFIVTGTTVIGFGANMTSDLDPIWDFGFIAALGVIFTFLIFGIFMPAAKVFLDDFRRDRPIPEFGSQPLGSEGSPLGRILPIGAHIAKRAPAIMLAVILVASLGAGVVATDIDTQFDSEDFLPYEDVPAYIEVFPEPLGPSDNYQIREIVTFLSDTFESGESDEITVYIEGPLYEGYALESVHRAGQEPPSSFVVEENQAVSESIVDVIHRYAEEDDEFAALVNRSDTNENGVPDRNLALIYDRLFASEFGPQAREYMTEDRQSMRVIYSVDAEASQAEITEDSHTLADRNRLDAIPTAQPIIFHGVTQLLLASALLSLSAALGLTALYFFLIYGALEGRPSLGLANIVPIIVTVTFLGATMAVLGIPFNALTATALSITIGIGVDYSVHVTHRFIDEYDQAAAAYPALVTTMQGAGGGITGSVITTVAGVGSLVLAVTPMLGQFGVLMAISVIYSYLASIIVLPPALLLWERFFGDETPAVPDEPSGDPTGAVLQANQD